MGAGEKVEGLKGSSILSLGEKEVRERAGRARETQVESRLRGAQRLVYEFPKLVEKARTHRKMDSGRLALSCF